VSNKKIQTAFINQNGYRKMKKKSMLDSSCDVAMRWTVEVSTPSSRGMDKCSSYNDVICTP